ncbi:uncharacterized protein DS421_16g548170 [Arachis hypogaea]|nr:uncharacterized protein DS421_16g548170 [Arachis hypogaea]
MGDDPARLYRLDGVAHIAGVINDEPQRCIRSMRRQQGMRLDDRYVPYLQMAGLYHLARLNDRWFRLDEALVSAFVERWHPETHTFHMPFGECTITLQDVAYQLGLPVDGRYVQKYAVNCSWFQETFGECPEDADEDTVRRYARAYIMMLLGTQLFADKSGNRIHIRWLPYIATLEELGTYSWGSAALAWLYRCMCRVANRHVVKLAGPLQLLQSWIFWRFPRFRPAGYETFSWPLASRWSGYNPSGSEKGPRVAMWRLRIDQLQDREFIWMPYSSPDVLQVVHPKVLEPRHMALWRSVTVLIYFVVIEWHQIDPPSASRPEHRLSDVQGRERRRSMDSRQESVLRFDVVADPRPSHEFLKWWSQHRKRFLSPDTQLGDPRAVPVPVEASQRGPGRVPDMDRPEDVPDRHRVERRMGVGTRRSQREWRWPDHAMDDDYDAGPVRGGRRVQGGRARGRADRGDDDEDQHGHVGRGGSGAVAAAGTSTHDGGHEDTLVGDFGSPRFLEEITAIMQGDVTPRSGGQTSGTQAPLDVDLNEPPSSSAGHQFCLGGTPPSAFTAASESVAGPSTAPLHVAPPTQRAPQEDGDDIEDKEPFIRRGQRARVARRYGTGSHLFR